MDSTPIVGLAAAIGWVSLVTVEFYEKIYRTRIEDNHDKLQELGGQLKKKLASKAEDIAEKGKQLSVLQTESNQVHDLLEAEGLLRSWRRWIFRGLLVATILCLVASYYPDPSLLFFAYFILAVVFLGGFAFLFKLFWFDERLAEIVTNKLEHTTDALLKR